MMSSVAVAVAVSSSHLSLFDCLFLALDRVRSKSTGSGGGWFIIIH